MDERLLESGSRRVLESSVNDWRLLEGSSLIPEPEAWEAMWTADRLGETLPYDRPRILRETRRIG